MQSTSFGFTYPTVWAAIPLLVEENVKGTACGFATATRFGTIAICYVVAGILTDPGDGRLKYRNVQVMLVILVTVSIIFYVTLWVRDIRWNGSTLRKVPGKRGKLLESTEISETVTNTESNVPMQQVV